VFTSTSITASFVSSGCSLTIGASTTAGGVGYLWVSSCSPCAKRHLSPYLQFPFSLKFLQISNFFLAWTEEDYATCGKDGWGRVSFCYEVWDC
jgi:hypothetical protein